MSEINEFDEAGNWVKPRNRDSSIVTCNGFFSYISLCITNDNDKMILGCLTLHIDETTNKNALFIYYKSRNLTDLTLPASLQRNENINTFFSSQRHSSGILSSERSLTIARSKGNS